MAWSFSKLYIRYKSILQEMSEDMQTNMQQTTFKLDNDFHVFMTFLCKGCQGSYCLMTIKEPKTHGRLKHFLAIVGLAAYGQQK